MAKKNSDPQNPPAEKPLKEDSNYTQVRKQATVSRMLGNEWYSGTNKDLTLHVFEDMNSMETLLFFKPGKKWTNGPDLRPQDLYDPEKFVEVLKILLATPDGSKAKGLAVIIHTAKDHFLTLPKESLNEEDTIKAMREKNFPTENQKINDSEQDQFIWRWVPAFPHESRLARIPKVLSDVIGRMPDEVSSKPVHYTIRNSVVDALTMVHVLSHLRKPDTPQPTVPVDGRISIFYYDHVSLLVLQNKEGETVNIRPFPHMQTAVPKELTTAVFSTILDNDKMQHIEVRIFAMGQNTTGELVQKIIDAEPAGFTKTISLLMFETPYEAGLMLAEQLGHNLSNGGNKLRLRTDYLIYQTDKLHQLSHIEDSASYTRLKPLIPDLDFSQRVKSTVTRTDISLLLGGQLVSMLVMFVLIGFGGFKLWDIYQSMTSPEWQLPVTASEESKVELEKVTKDKEVAKSWQSAFLPRSKAWQQMELLSSLFPEGSGFQVDTLSYRTTYLPDSKEWKRTWDIVGKTDEYGNNLFRDYDVQKNFPKIGPYKLAEIDWTTQNLLENDANLIPNRRSRTEPEQVWKKKEATTTTRPYVFSYRSNLVRNTNPAPTNGRANSNKYSFTLKIEQEVSEEDTFSF